MVTVLLLCSAVLVLVAVAIELWWGAGRRERQRASLQHTEQRLAANPATPVLAGMPTRPAQRGSVRPSSVAGSSSGVISSGS